MGSHDALMRECQVYRRLWEAQRAAHPASTAHDLETVPDDFVLGH
jgi:hypothetical protein